MAAFPIRHSSRYPVFRTSPTCTLDRSTDSTPRIASAKASRGRSNINHQCFHLATFPLLTVATSSRFHSIAISAVSTSGTTKLTLSTTMRNSFNRMVTFSPVHSTSSSLESQRSPSIDGRITWFLRSGLRHTFHVWQQALALIQFLVIQASLASFGTVPTVCCSRPADLTGKTDR